MGYPFLGGGDLRAAQFWKAEQVVLFSHGSFQKPDPFSQSAWWFSRKQEKTDLWKESHSLSLDFFGAIHSASELNGRWKLPLASSAVASRLRSMAP